jgi:vesicle-fusing ATPase
MIKEMAIGGALAVLIYLGLRGHNPLPFLFLGGLLYVLSQSAVGRTGRREVRPVARGESGSVTFAEIGGQETAKRELKEALDFAMNQRGIRLLGIRPIKGILLTGPPGTGKTMLARAAAAYTNSAFLSISGSEFIEIYAGVGAQRVRQLFADAREAARHHGGSTVIFIDELEVIGGRRGQHTSHLEYDQTLNQLLVAMDGIAADSVRILVIGATNRLDLLDPALLRPGRLDRIVRVDLPDRAGRLAILKIHTANKPLHQSANLERLAGQTFGFSGAHLESLANEAAILALRQGAELVEQAHLEEAVDKVILGEKLSRLPGRGELERIAVHELGHALVAETIAPGAVTAVTISPRGAALGYVRQAEESDLHLYPLTYLEDRIAILLAGAVAEEVVLGSRSTAATDDIERASRLARTIVGSGLSRLGAVSEELLSPGETQGEARTILRSQEARVYRLIHPRRAALSRVCPYLLERERLPGDELRRLLNLGNRRRRTLPCRMARAMPIDRKGQEPRTAKLSSREGVHEGGDPRRRHRTAPWPGREHQRPLPVAGTGGSRDRRLLPRDGWRQSPPA